LIHPGVTVRPQLPVTKIMESWNRDASMHYPFAGFLFLLASPSLWGTVLCVVLLGFTIALTSVLMLFVFTFRSQANVLGGGEWWSYVLAIVAVLFESLFLTFIILKMVHTKCQIKIFMETMKAKGHWTADMKAPSVVRDFDFCKLGFFVKIATFPLNLIPVAGTILFAYINAPFAALDLMDMYFEAIHMDYEAQMIEVTRCPNRSCGAMYTYSPYLRFGFISMLLETIPVVGPAVFSLSNSCGAALWACDMHAQGGPPSWQQNRNQIPTPSIHHDPNIIMDSKAYQTF
jgi:hypothetical protein